MFKLIRNVNLLKGIQNSRISGNVLACRSMSDGNPRMERTINSVQILGRVGVEPQQRGNEAHPVVTFSVATHSNYKTENGDWLQRVDWHKIAVFKPQLRESVINYMTKGQRVLLNGKIAYGEIKDKDGVSRPSTTIIADEIVFLQ